MAKPKHQNSAVLLPSSVSNSPSSPRSSADSYGTDDSMEHQQQHAASNHQEAPTSQQQQQSKSAPILVKYNYYDYNGERQENHELLYLAANNNSNHHAYNHNINTNNNVSHKQLQRQLSPTFKQNLEQILVKSGGQGGRNLGTNTASNVHNSAGINEQEQRQQQLRSSPVSPSAHTSLAASATMLLARRYNRSSYEHRCLRCKQTVYQMDKVGPLKDFSFYHKNCFKCFECGTKLTLKTYFNNQHSSTDLQVYCHRHCPKTPAGRLDNQSVGIRAALNAPKVFEPALQLPGVTLFCSDEELTAKCPMSPMTSVDTRALHIQHAMRQTKLQAIYKHSQVDKKISQFLNRRLEYLEPKQKMLEMRHRQEEEQLFHAFELKWRQEEQQIRDQIRDEWQLELNKLLDKYKRQLSSLSASDSSSASTSSSVSASKQVEQQRHLNSTNVQQQQQQQHNKQRVAASIAAAAAARAAKQRQQQHAIAAAAAAATAASTTTTTSPTNTTPEQEQMIELERMNLEKTMTIKLDRKKETLKRKLKEFERQATAELVEKQSREMLALISMKLEEFKEEQKRKIGSDLEQFEALEVLASQLGDSLQFGSHAQQNGPASASAAGTNSDEQQQARLVPVHATQNATKSGTNSATNSQIADTPKMPPAPCAPKVSKWQLYNDEQADELFNDIDKRAINIAQEDQQTFTDLVHHLTRHCLTDIEKVRAIFRWITVKNLNTMQFDSSIKPDTPFGLLRGIKQGSESYHVLFKRLCSYAGLHCVVIKGYSKSAGYQPGVPFEGNRFRNSWNAVYVAGAWRFVQCNWGARHLVSVAVMRDKNSSDTDNKQALNLTNRSGGSLMVAPQASHQDSTAAAATARKHHHHQLGNGICSPAFSSASSSSTSSSSSARRHKQQQVPSGADDDGSSTQPASDSLRYEYDDHYFLTDPDEFIYEFFPLDNEWQLLSKTARPITLTEFEQLPFVRSLFFKYGLYFPQPDIRSVLYTDSSGATTIKIGMPTHMVPNLIFHYNLKYYNSDQEQYDGISLKRFVMQSVESGAASNNNSNGAVHQNNEPSTLISNIVSFRVHVPENGAYILDIFANSTTPTQYITGEPMKFKSVCKFKIIAKNLRTVMIPLPDCASGEYGPMKATRLFGIIPLTHENGLISLVCNDKSDINKRYLEIQFRMTRPLLDFMASLHKNGSDERILSRWIKIFIEGDIVFITIKFQEDGQYGLDIYTRDQQQVALCSEKTLPDNKKQLLTHCCKYLINVRSTTPAR